jgi:hypothetical protein
LIATPSFAVVISLTGGFTNFYTPFAYGTESNLPGDLITNFVNGQQLCPVNLTGNPANNCKVDGEAFVDFATPVTSVAWQIFDFGTPWTENLVSFTPATNQIVNGFGPDNNFLFGTVTFTNGIWSAGSRLSYNITAISDDPVLNANYDFEVSGVLVVQGTNNLVTNTADQNADFIYLEDNPGLGSLRAYELSDSPTGTNVVSADIYGYLDSLHFAEFANAHGGGFIDGGVALEPTPVPEPATWQLAICGLVPLLGFRLRAKYRSGRAAT